MTERGKFDQEIAIEQSVVSEDSYGQEKRAWSTFLTAWARVWVGRGDERRQLARESGRQAATFAILEVEETRAITIDMRIQHAGSAWDIDGIALHTPVRGQMEITAVRSA